MLNMRKHADLGNIQYKNIDAFLNTYGLYHGTSANIIDNALSFGKGDLRKGGQSGGLFLTDNRQSAQTFGDTVYRASSSIKEQVLDLTRPENINYIKRYVGKPYNTWDNEELIFSIEDFNLMFPEGKADFATISQYPEIIEQAVEDKGLIGVAFNEYAGGAICKTYQILKGDIPLYSEQDLINSYNKAHKKASILKESAGYADDYSKSNNAIEAEDKGLFPATEIAKRLGKGCTSTGVKKVLSPKEWHHTSKYYNATDYYSLEEAFENIDDIRAASKVNAQTRDHIFKDVNIEYLEWSGSRAHPHATKKTLIADIIDNEGQFITIMTNPPFKKKKDATGLVLNGWPYYRKFVEKYYETHLEEYTGYLAKRILNLNKQAGIDNIRFETGGDALGKEYQGYIVAYEKDTGKKIGYVNYTYFDGTTYIRMIEVVPEYRRQGYGTLLLQKLQDESSTPLQVFGNYLTSEGKELWVDFKKQYKQAFTMQDDLSPETSLTLNTPVPMDSPETIMEALGTSFDKINKYLKKNGEGDNYVLPYIEFNTPDEAKMRKFFTIPEGTDTKSYLQSLGKQLTAAFLNKFPDYKRVSIHFGKQDNLYYLFLVK